MGFGFGGSNQKTSSSSSSSMNQNVWGPQADAMGNMYTQAGNLYGSMMPYANLGMGMMPQMQNWMANAYNLGNRGAENLISGGSYGDTSGTRDSLYASLNNSLSAPSNVGRMYQDIVGGAGNTYIDPLVKSMRGGYADELARQQASAGMDAAAAGQGGSSRHAMQNAMLGAQSAKDQANMENQLRAGAYDTDLNWKMDIARMADANQGAAQDRAMNLLAGRDANVNAGMGFAPTMQNLSMGYMAPWMQAMQGGWMNMNNYNNMFGDPTVLTDAQSKGTSKGSGKSFNLGAGGL